MGPADCNHCNCNHALFRESSFFQRNAAQVLIHSVVTIAVVTVCWSYEILFLAEEHAVRDVICWSNLCWKYRDFTQRWGDFTSQDSEFFLRSCWLDSSSPQVIAILFGHFTRTSVFLGRRLTIHSPPPLPGRRAERLARREEGGSRGSVADNPCSQTLEHTINEHMLTIL